MVRMNEDEVIDLSEENEYEDEEIETYIEDSQEEDYDDSDFSLNDAAFVGFTAIIVCAIFAFVIKTISKHLKNVNLKVGNKLEIGIESKDKEVKKD